MSESRIGKPQATPGVERTNASPRHCTSPLATLPITVLREVFGHLDGTTLARASGVCRAWSQATRDDWLWRELCFRERHQWVGSAPRTLAAPTWAIERAKGPECPQPPRSWRQAYRLLAMIEHGRPDGSSDLPMFAADAEIGPPPRWHAVAPTDWLSPGEVETLLLPQFGRHPPFERELYGEMRSTRRQLTRCGTTVAIRSARGDVLLAWHEQKQPRYWLLPLRQGGFLASEVRLVPREPSDERGVGNVHVLTRSGYRWRRWQHGQATAAATFPGRIGHFVRVQDRQYWLAADSPSATYSRLSLCDFATGVIFQTYCDNYVQVGATLLTELGPMVGWVAGGWQARILWSSRAELLGPNLRPVDPLAPWRVYARRCGNRPQRIDTSALPSNAQIVDSALSEEVPGRILLWWTDGTTTASSFHIASGHVDGWGRTELASR